MEVFAMIYELRVYQPVPGQMPKLLARFRDKLLPLWERHGIRPIGFWTTLVGESSNELTYILPWESLADRETRWTAFQQPSPASMPRFHNSGESSPDKVFERDTSILRMVGTAFFGMRRCDRRARHASSYAVDEPHGYPPQISAYAPQLIMSRRWQVAGYGADA
jgi:NIPSNAP